MAGAHKVVVTADPKLLVEQEDLCNNGSNIRSSQRWFASSTSKNVFQLYQERKLVIKASALMKLKAEQKLLDDQIANISAELEFRRSAGRAMRQSHEEIVQDCQQYLANLAQRYHESLLNPNNQRGGSRDSMYIAMIRQVCGPGTMYIRTLEGKFCRAAHYREILGKQLKLVQDQAKRTIEAMRKAITTTKKEQVELLNNMRIRRQEVERDLQILTERYTEICEEHCSQPHVSLMTEELFETVDPTSSRVESYSEASIEQISSELSSNIFTTLDLDDVAPESSQDIPQ